MEISRFKLEFSHLSIHVQIMILSFLNIKETMRFSQCSIKYNVILYDIIMVRESHFDNLKYNLYFSRFLIYQFHLVTCQQQDLGNCFNVL